MSENAFAGKEHSLWQQVIFNEFHETCHSVTSYFMKKTRSDAVTPQHRIQFIPKMKSKFPFSFGVN